MDNPIEIASFVNVHQAEFAISVLEGSGIEAYLDQPFLGNIAPHYMWGTGGVRLFVAAGDAQLALEVLASANR